MHLAVMRCEHGRSKALQEKVACANGARKDRAEVVRGLSIFQAVFEGSVEVIAPRDLQPVREVVLGKLYVDNDALGSRAHVWEVKSAGGHQHNEDRQWHDALVEHSGHNRASDQKANRGSQHTAYLSHSLRASSRFDVGSESTMLRSYIRETRSASASASSVSLTHAQGLKLSISDLQKWQAILNASTLLVKVAARMRHMASQLVDIPRCPQTLPEHF
jgi:hypothetical protein